MLLGAFAAGIVVSLFSAGEDSVVIREKLEAIGFGFLVPIFFVVSGMQFDLHSLIHKPSALLQIPLFLLLFLVIRGLPALYVYRKYLPKGQLIPLALFSATGLPLIVVIADIGVSAHRMAPENAAALIAVGSFRCSSFPSPVYAACSGMRPRRRREAPPAPRRPNRTRRPILTRFHPRRWVLQEFLPNESRASAGSRSQEFLTTAPLRVAARIAVALARLVIHRNCSVRGRFPTDLMQVDHHV